MSEERNRTHVAIVVGDTRQWILYVPATAQTFEKQRQEIVELGSNVCASFQDIFSPSSVDYIAKEVEKGTVSDVRESTFHRPNRPTITRKEKGTSDDLRDAQEFRSVIYSDVEHACQGEACFIPQIEIRGKTNITLADTTQWLDRRSEDRVKLYNRRKLVGTASQDPMYLKIRYLKGWNDQEDPTDVRYKVHIKTFTDIWTETTEIGKRNRRRLEECFHALRDNVEYDSVSADFEADRNFGDELASILRT